MCTTIGYEGVITETSYALPRRPDVSPPEIKFPVRQIVGFTGKVPLAA